MLFCVDYRLREPVNLVRANWIRPEDLHHYESMGYTSFKIVERNTPTPELLRRVHAYANRRYDGNLLDLVLPFAYPEEAYQDAAAREAYSLRRAVRYFFKPGQINVTRIPLLVELGKRLGLMYPRRGAPKMVLDNRKMDGFIDRFLKTSCIDQDCEECRYCHGFAERALSIDPAWREKTLESARRLFDDMQGGRFWFPKARDLVEGLRLALGARGDQADEHPDPRPDARRKIA